MKKLVEIRNQESMCRERASGDSERKVFWLAQAEKWEQRALDEIAFYFRECNRERADSCPAASSHANAGNFCTPVTSQIAARPVRPSWIRTDSGRERAGRVRRQCRRSGLITVCLTSAPQSEHS